MSDIKTKEFVKDDMYPLYWTTPAKGVHLCDTVTSSNETLSIYIGKASGRKRRKESNRETFISKCVYGLE